MQRRAAPVSESDRLARASELMLRFAERTGLSSSRAPRRYLWTDAFAVCNFLGLARTTGEERHRELALRLIDQVHRELGRHRKDDRLRAGWLSGLPEEQGAAHPTVAGLRIGKELPERSPSEPFDPDLEWERDGQYFHYLTKWTFALDQAARATERPTFHRWARELAVSAHRAFAGGPPAQRRMAWKLSVDLSRPLVTSMGQHDPLDGLVACAELEDTASRLGLVHSPGLTGPMADYAQMLEPRLLPTSDPMGIGGLLVDAARLVQTGTQHELVASILEAAIFGLHRYLATSELRDAAHRRLAFRELGLATGLAAVPMLWASRPRALDDAGNIRLSELVECLPLRDEIQLFWLDEEHRRSRAWVEHLDINEVMLATALAPSGFLELAGMRPISVEAPCLA